MIDETSGIIGWPIGQQYKELAVRNEASTTTWETLVEQYRERAARDDARIDELRQSTEHWHDTAQMLKRQRDTAEEDRDGWKIRAMQSEQGRQVNRDLLIIAEGQRDQAKMRAEAAEAEREALRKDAARLDYLDTVRDPYSLRPMREVIGTEWSIVFTHRATHTPTIREAIDGAMAVQPTTGEAK